MIIEINTSYIVKRSRESVTSESHYEVFEIPGVFIIVVVSSDGTSPERPCRQGVRRVVHSRTRTRSGRVVYSTFFVSVEKPRDERGFWPGREVV